jgi:hypothetical protein
MGQWRLRSYLATIAFFLIGTFVAGLVPGAASAQDTASVRVVHGLRGLVADVYVDGQLVLPTFQPERSTDPLSIPAGSHDIEIRSAGAGLRSTPLLAQTVEVPAGFSGSLVAHLNARGEPVLTAFADDSTPVPAGQARVVVRHTGDVGPVAVTVGELPALDTIAPGTEVSTQVPAGQYRVAVASGRGADLLTTQGVDLAEGTANFMYLIGSQEDGSLSWAAVRIPNVETAPAQIQTGDGSTSRQPGDDRVIVVVVAALVGGLVLSHRTLRRLLPG